MAAVVKARGTPASPGGTPGFSLTIEKSNIENLKKIFDYFNI